MLDPEFKKMIVRKAVLILKQKGHENVNEETIFLDERLSQELERMLRESLMGENTDIQLKRIIKIIEKIRKIRRGTN